jgi:branched-chain amino acid transport system substrate-binding protein
MLDAAQVAVEASGGKMVGVVHTPVNTSDFSSFLLQAMTSEANAIGMIEGGSDLVVALKQSQEFGVTKNGQKIAVAFAQLSDMKALGLPLAQGLVFTEAFYGDADEAKRGFARRFAERNRGKYPTAVQAGAYSAVLHYLKAVEAAVSDHGPTVVARMKEMPVADPLFGPAILRRDGRMVHDMYLVEAKKPHESKSDWDLYKILRKVPGDEAFRPMSRSCSLVSEGK